MITPDLIERNLEKIRADITSTARYAMLDTLPNPEIIAVSKRQPTERIKAALDAGHRIFGENKVQEAYDHWANIRDTYPDLKLHLIGALQTNKVRDAITLFDVIETVDREKLVRHLARIRDEINTCPRLFIQVNTGAEPQKSGVLIENLDGLIKTVREANLPLDGLMCIPPKDDDPALHFGLLKKLASAHGLPKLSMGMSADYDIAAVMGADQIRVGTAIFGERPH